MEKTHILGSVDLRSEGVVGTGGGLVVEEYFVIHCAAPVAAGRQ